MHPVLIAGAVLVALPIAIHLIMKQEPKRVRFPAFRFLKQKNNRNQRKLRLRHFLLLALRMLLIALFALALYQPSLNSTGMLPLAGESPVALVLVLDTTPSMAYKANGKTRLDDAKRRVLELLDDLPAESRVAILEPGDPTGVWEQSIADARSKINAITEPRGGTAPITAALPVAYQLLRTVDQDTDAKEPLPKLVAVVSDRTSASWVSDRTEDLKKQKDSLPPPPVAHLLIDVGVDQPSNVSITNAAAIPPVVPAGAIVKLSVTVTSTGADVESVVKLEGMPGLPEKRPVRVPAGTARVVTFEIKDLPQGFYQAKLSLETEDNLPDDDKRYATFKVAQARKILAISDDPSDADVWAAAHRAMGEFECIVLRPALVKSLAGFESVTLLNCSDPTKPTANGTTSLWDVLRPYVEGGGKLIVIPGPPSQFVAPSYDPARDPTAAILMPAALRTVLDTQNAPAPPVTDPPTQDRRLGVKWYLDDQALKHPLLSPFKEWKQQGNIDVIQFPPRANRYWEAEPVAGGTVVVRYDDDEDAAKKRPAIMERAVGTTGGKVLLMTTRLDAQAGVGQEWNDYWKNADSSFGVVLPHVLMTYLCGRSADAQFNFNTGRDLTIPIPRSENPGTWVDLSGPGISGRDGRIELAPNQTEVRFAANKTLTPGNFTLTSSDGKAKDGYSLNPSAEEFTLDKTPAEAIEALFGPKSIVPLTKDVKLRDALTTQFNQPVDLFPYLLLLVLVLVCLEGLIANRFYKRVG